MQISTTVQGTDRDFKFCQNLHMHMESIFTDPVIYYMVIVTMVRPRCIPDLMASICVGVNGTVFLHDNIIISV